MTHVPYSHVTKSADGTAIAWYDYGGDGPNVLLAHATGFCARMWEPVITALKSRYRCVTFDTRGHGLSLRPPVNERSDTERWSWYRFADDAAAVMAAADLEDAYFLGHSSGATAGVLVEERVNDMFRKMCLFEPVLFADEPPKGPDFARDLVRNTRNRRAEFPDAETARMRFRERGPFQGFTDEALGAYLRYGFVHHDDGRVSLRCKPEDEAIIYATASDNSSFVELDSVKCPVLIVRGSSSRAFSKSEYASALARLPQGRYSAIRAVSHFGPFERPARVAELARKFFMED